ncbi:hypothetical protein NKG94_02640 [Micromonospora sp. M12]
MYEREAGRSARAQGGMLDLHPESGQQALAEAGLTDGFRSEARPEGEEHRILDPAGRTLVHHKPRPGSFSGRPRSTAAHCATFCSIPSLATRWSGGTGSSRRRRDPTEASG